MTIQHYAKETLSNLRSLLIGRSTRKAFYREVGALLRTRDELKQIGIEKRKDLSKIFEALPSENRTMSLNRQIRYAEAEKVYGQEALDYILVGLKMDTYSRQRKDLSRFR